jgi:predicted DNA-binding transcriptional regulator YafY
VPSSRITLLTGSKNVGRLYRYLQCAAGDHGIVWATLDALAEGLKVDKRTISRATATLVEQRALVVVRLGDAHGYVLDPRRLARRRRPRRLRGHLPACLLLSDEQTEELETALRAFLEGSE